MKHDQIEEFFVWDETNLIETQNNCDDKIKNDDCNSIIKNINKDITDPKLRRKAYDKAYREANKDKAKAYDKAYWKANPDKAKAKSKAYREANPDKTKARHKVYREANLDKTKARHKAYREANLDKINARHNNRIKTDIQYKLSRRLRTRLYCALQGNQKTGSAVKDLGCSIDELKTHLESKFQSGMTWDNWSFEGWHIDHIKPLASFDLTDRKQLLLACHYTNLQPLWAIDNLSKGDRTESN